MRKIIVGSFISLDGVMQAVGGPEEGFEYGGWSAPYYDEALDKIAEKQKDPIGDLLLGRRTFEMFASFWPQHEEIWPGVNNARKYVLSSTLAKSDPVVTGWKNSVILKTVEDLKKLKESEGPDLKVHGSGKLVQTLLKHNLVDELWLFIHPLMLGIGQKVFPDGAIPAAFTLVESKATPSGVIAVHYKPAGKIKTGSMVA
jgi:dihydrofolate reductase